LFFILRKEPKKKLWPLFVGTIGVVYGDIGTSPLYTIKTCFESGAIIPDAVNIIGVISLIFWALFLVVTLKYVSIILRADNRGEGGVFALVALISRYFRNTKKSNRSIIIGLGVLGAALLYGDGVITPAISVLGALEGLSVASPKLSFMIVPVAVILLITLFWYQKSGTAKIGKFFGSIMMVWFISIALVAIIPIIQEPRIFLALNPWYAFHVLKSNGILSIHILGTIVLAVTGVEALYADLGHFTKYSIRFSWFSLVLPALLMNYFGQGATMLKNPDAYVNPFYIMVPELMLYPMIILATVASIIASQAVITGLFSITWQAVLLGFMPRMRIVHTSPSQRGQVYVPFINNSLLVLTVLSVLLFKSSDSLASAYGLTITGIMLITTALTIVLSHYTWKWSIPKIISVFTIFICIDIIFFASSITKILDGAWYTVCISTIFGVVMYTWRKGMQALAKIFRKKRTTLAAFSKDVGITFRKRVPGTAVYMTRTANSIPSTVFTNRNHNHCLHENIIILSVEIKNVPRVAPSKRIKEVNFNNGIYQVKAYYGFIEVPNILKIFKRLEEKAIRNIDIKDISFFIGRGIPVESTAPYLSGWVEKLFIFLFNNAASATEFYKLPDDRVVELGTRVHV